MEEVPSGLLAGGKWKTVMADRWKFEENILLLEARALVNTASRAADSWPVKEARVLLLGDNLAVVMAFCRYRAREDGLLVHVRRVASIALSRGISSHVRWIPNESNSGDEGSRRF